MPPESRPERYEGPAELWEYLPTTPEELGRLRRDLRFNKRLEPANAALELAVSEFGGNFFKHGNAAPGRLRIFRSPNTIRLEVDILGMTDEERDFQELFWGSGDEVAAILIASKYEQDVWGDKEVDIENIAEGGRGMLLVRFDADRYGFTASEENDQPCMVWVEYECPPREQPTDSLPRL